MLHFMKTGTAAGILATTLLMLPCTTPLAAQQPPATLTLQDALRLARQYNPTYRMTANDENVADWARAEAYGSLLPGMDVSSRLGYQLPGTPRLGDISAEELGISRSPAAFSSSYAISVGMSFSGATLFQLAQARANAKATGARVDAAGFTLDADITRQYLAAMRARDLVTLRQQEFAAADEAWKLADARVAAGAAPRLDVTQAEVARGRAEVAVLQSQNDARAARLALLQAIGVELDRDVELTTELVVTEPAFDMDELVARAMSSHPSTVAARANEAAGKAAARASRMQYLPTISIGGGWQGYTRRVADDQYVIGSVKSSAAGRVANCEFENALNARLSSPHPDLGGDCAALAYTDAMGLKALEANDVSPFDFAQQPPSFGLTVSMPIFNGFTRERQMQQANAQAEDARHLRRQEELSRRAQVINAYHNLMTAYRMVGIEERNAAAGAEQLRLATERYRLNAGSIIELNQAQTAKAQADQARLAAIYAFHESLAALEAAVGRPLR